MTSPAPPSRSGGDPQDPARASRGRATGSRAPIAARIGLLLASLGFSFALAECGLRAIDGEWETRNFLWSESFLLGEASPALHDAELGWVPRPGAQTRYRGEQVTIGDDGLRSLGPGTPTTGATRILAVGDSYTFGSQVGDAEAWPALLARRLDARIWNGGVFNYGVDQTVLHAERLIARLQPEVVIASLIPSDILRTELRLRGHAPKPWFEQVEGRLELRGVPVPEAPSRASRIGLLRATLAHSYLVHRAMLAVAPRIWILGAGPDQRAHREGVAVSCALLHRLAGDCAARDIRLAILAQTVDAPQRFERRALVEALLPCLAPLEARGVALLDLHPILEDVRARKPRAHARLFDGHMTAGGNAWVAEHLARLLVERGWAERRVR